MDNPPSLSEPTQRRTAIPPSPMVAKYAPGSTDHTATVNVPTATSSPLQTVLSPPVTDEVTALQDSNGLYDPIADDNSIADVAIEWVSSGDDIQARSAAWRVRMTVVSLIAGVLIYIITRDYVSTGSVVLVGTLFGFMGARKAPALHYRLDRSGLFIGQHLYTYSEFRAFSVSDDPQVPSINIVPLKRFLPLLSVYYDVQQRDKIVEVLAAHLPMEAPRHDAFDSIINRIKF